MLTFVQGREHVVDEAQQGIPKTRSRFPVAGVLHHRFQTFKEIAEDSAFALPVNVVQR
jgi:hypothetical protein